MTTKTQRKIERNNYREAWAIGRIVSLVLCGAFLTGCATPKKLSDSFSPTGLTSSQPVIERLIVHEAKEARPNKGKARVGQGFIAIIPFVPFAKQEFTPEHFMQFHSPGYNFRQDVAITVAKDLQSAGFSRQVIAPSGYIFGDISDDDSYVLNLTLTDGVWYRNFTCYGISISAPYIWIFGIPCSYGDIRLAFQAELRAPGGKVIGRRTFSDHRGYTETMYNGMKFMRHITDCYRQISPQLRNFIADALRQHQPTIATNPPQVKPPKKATTPSAGIATRLKELKELKEAGVLTDEEYETKRKALAAEL